MPVKKKSRLSQIARNLDREVIDALEPVADRVTARAVESVSVDTGRLKSKIRKERASEGWRIIAGDDEAWYGHLVEFGTQAHEIPNAFGRGITVQHPGASGKPFLIPALEAERESVEEVARVHLRDL